MRNAVAWRVSFGQRHGRRCQLACQLSAAFSSTGNPACANAITQRYAQPLARSRLRSLLYSSVGFSLRPRKNTPSTPPQLPREIVLLVNIPPPRELSGRRLQCYTPARACSDTHSTDRNRTGDESNFPFTRLYSGSYAWPLLCTGIQFLKQIGAPHVVEA